MWASGVGLPVPIVHHPQNTQDIKNHQIEISELKNAIPERENTLDSIAEWKLTSTEITQSEK